MIQKYHNKQRQMPQIEKCCIFSGYVYIIIRV